MSCPWYLHPELLDGDLQRGMSNELENTREGTRLMPAPSQMVMVTSQTHCTPSHSSVKKTYPHWHNLLSALHL